MALKSSSAECRSHIFLSGEVPTKRTQSKVFQARKYRAELRSNRAGISPNVSPGEFSFSQAVMDLTFR